MVTLSVIGIQWLLFMGATKVGNKAAETFIAGPGGRVGSSS